MKVMADIRNFTLKTITTSESTEPLTRLPKLARVVGLPTPYIHLASSRESVSHLTY